MTHINFTTHDVLAAFRVHFRHEHDFAFQFNTDKAPIVSKQGIIYVLEGTSKQRYAMRIPVHLADKSHDLAAKAVSYHVNLLKRLADSGFGWSPRVMAQSAEYSNEIGFPYIIVGWIEGRVLEWNHQTPYDRAMRDRVLWQMADILLELAMCTQETRCGHSAESYTTELVDWKMLHVSRGDYPNISLHDCLIQRALVHKALAGVPAVSSFSISHEALSARNILVDDAYNVVGIVGWGFSRPLPIQFTVRFPRFLTTEPDLTDSSPLSPENPDSAAFLTPSSTLRIDRAFFLTSILTNVEPQCPHAAIRRWVSFAVSDADTDWRHLVVESALRLDMHDWMSKRGWLLDAATGMKPSTEDLMKQIDGFEQFLERNRTHTKGPDRKTLLTAIGA